MRGDADYRSSSGFTFSELLVVLTMTLTLALAGWAFYRAQVRSLVDQSGQLDAVEGARAALDLMAQEIRTAGSDPSAIWLGPPTSPNTVSPRGLNLAQASQLQIRRDVSGDGAIQTNAVDPNAESILYTYNSGTQQILRTVNGVAQILIRNAVGLTFTYSQPNGTVVTPSGSPAQLTAAQADDPNTALVRVTVNVNAARSSTPRVVTLSARAAIRSRLLRLGRL